MLQPYYYLQCSGLVLLIFGILTFHQLYSGNNDQAVIYVSPSVIDRLPVANTPHICRARNRLLGYQPVGLRELNVPVYPEPRIYKKMLSRSAIRRRFLQTSGQNKRETPTRYRTSKSEFYDCDHLDTLP